MEKQYFASLPALKLAKKLMEKRDNFYKYLESSKRFRLMKNVYDTYYRPGLDFGEITLSGDNGEFLNIAVNHFRNIIEHSTRFVTSQRLHFEPKAINTDTRSMLQAQLASSVLEYYNRVKKMEKFTRIAVENCLMYGEAFISSTWNPNDGKLIGVSSDGVEVFEGDINFDNLIGLDVIRDANVKEFSDHQWLMTRTYVNKYDLIAQFPDLAEKIINIDFRDEEPYKTHLTDETDYHYTNSDSEMIPIYTFYHKPTPAVPEGRMTEILSADIVLFDGPLPYDEIPVYRISPSEQTDNTFGYSVSFDLLPLQYSLNQLHSAIITNQAAFGVQNIALPKGNDLNTTEIGKGMRIIEYDIKAGPPSALQLLQTPAEIFDYAQQLVQAMETISGVNSVSRGNPEASLRSGSALALVQSMSIQFSQSLQQSYVQLLEDLGTSVVNLLKRYANTKRVALISGKSNRSKLAAFKGDDLEGINRVMVDIGNPLTRTVAGRINIAEQLIQQGLIQNPQQYIEVLTTGRIEPMYESELAELNLIRAENESLSSGDGDVPAIRTDNHAMHIQEHLAVLATPEARKDPARVNAVLDHIAEHERLQMEVQQMGIGQREQIPAVTGQDSTAIDESGEIAETLQSQDNPEIRQDNLNISMPSMPKIAGTDQEFDPNEGQ